MSNAGMSEQLQEIRDQVQNSDFNETSKTQTLDRRDATITSITPQYNRRATDKLEQVQQTSQTVSQQIQQQQNNNYEINKRMDQINSSARASQWFATGVIGVLGALCVALLCKGISADKKR